MTYAYEVQTIEAQGVPYVEFRHEAEPTETQIITIEFSPQNYPLDDYTYSQPLFVFGELVALREQWECCQQNQLDPNEELDWFKVCAMELIEPQSKSGRLTNPPYWLYGIRCQSGTRELMWFEEGELISKREIESGLEEF